MEKEEGMLPGTELNSRPRSPNKRVFVFHSPDVDVAHTEHDTGRQLSLTTAVYMSSTVIRTECDFEGNIALNSVYSNYVHPLQAYNMGKEEGRLPGTELNSRPRSPNKRVFVFHSPDVDVAHTEHDTGRQLSLTTAVYMSCTFITWGRKRECCLEPS
ncbi:hypothetical protein J6590_069947 [Homalodisca vitripennis]|nr:hypothetical protein J6590_069947 [Homalodisca vitripennis]